MDSSEQMEAKGIDLKDILSALISLVGTIFGSKYLRDLMHKRAIKRQQAEKDVLLASLKSIAEMDNCMEDVVKNTPVERFLIMSGQDSGRIPNPRSPYFVHVLWMKLKDGISHFVHYQDTIRVDANYVGIIINILTDSFFRIKVSEMKNSFLKRVYEKELIKYSELHFIKQEKSNVVYYLSIATTQENEFFDDPVARELINFNIDKIRQIFESYE